MLKMKFRTYLDSFTGGGEILETATLRRMFDLLYSEARAAGCSLTNAYASIIDLETGLEIGGMRNKKGLIMFNDNVIKDYNHE